MRHEYQDMVLIEEYLPQFSSNYLLFRMIYLFAHREMKEGLRERPSGQKKKGKS